MRVLGVDLGDPGGLALIDMDARGRVWHIRARELGPKDQGFAMQQLLHQLCQEQQPELVATERPFTGRWDPRPKVGLAQREKQGLVKAVCESLSIRFVDFQPQTIKKAVCGNGHAPKSQVARAVTGITGFVHPSEHVMDAVAIALLAARRARSESVLKSQQKLGLRRPRRKVAIR